MHVIIWEFVVSNSHRATFEKAYGPDGDWALLFREAAGYVGTELVRDELIPDRYLTIDRWTTRDAFIKFKQSAATVYDDLDRQCEGMTVREAKVGTFDLVSS
ncbi:antibiotic biosynthesis monooxygenase family protein [Microvirga rosea]|uniref:antibiotic biosynthesis monooxygenase family protein n=1 Tax=Microvirga rosea TaxID=2715425 RepID=UPI001D0AD835|nr:antibiotic biosynthesis monooxygenase [Microvirga rosea]MCB8819506.1 antibiotic biosynthesis monooxygenase [Microvirga rosea]